MRHRRLGAHLRARRARAASRAAAPRAAADGHQARALVQPARPGLRRGTHRRGRPTAGGDALPPIRRRPRRDRARRAPASRSTTSVRGTRCTSSRFASPTGSSPPASGWSSWPTADIAGPELWLSDGWYAVQEHGWDAPVYWRLDESDGWSVFTLTGRRPIDPAEPVVHVSHYEADAFARWAGRASRPSSSGSTRSGRSRIRSTCNAAGSPTRRPHRARLQPAPATGGSGLRQAFGDVWQWTASAYLPYPRFAPAPGAVGEYNGKFMSGQMVLRGSACITPEGPRPPDLSQLLPTFESLDVRGPAARGQRVAATSPQERDMTAANASTPRVDVYLTPDDLRAALRLDAEHGLRSTPKDIPPKWFYDTRGSQLFDDITRLPEYYPTRCERAILGARADGDRRGQLRRHARGARLGNLREDPPPARRVTRRGHDHPLRSLRRERADIARSGRGREPRLPDRERARGRRRLRAPSSVDTRRRPAAGGVPRRHDRQPRASGPRRVPPRGRPRASAPTITCCSVSTSSRTSIVSKRRTTTVRA